MKGIVMVFCAGIMAMNLMSGVAGAAADPDREYDVADKKWEGDYQVAKTQARHSTKVRSVIRTNINVSTISVSSADGSE